MKRLIAGLALALAAAGVVRAETQSQVLIPLLIDFDIETATFAHSQGVPIATFGATSRAEGVLNEISSPIRITTAGVSSATVTAVTASTTPFAAIQAGDFIRLVFPGTERPDVMDVIEAGQNPWLKVVTRTSADQVVLNQAVIIPAAGVGFQWRRAIQATTEGAGWIPVSSFDQGTFIVRSRAHVAASGGLEVSVECRADQPGLDTFSAVPVSPRYGTDGTVNVPSTDCNVNPIALASNYAFCEVVSTSGVALTVDTAPYRECRVRLGFVDDVEGGTVDRIYAWFVGTARK